MTFERQAWCFLRKGATDADIAAALHDYALSRDLPFVATGEGGLEASGPGWAVRVTAVRRMPAVAAEVKIVDRRLSELRPSTMVITIDVAMDAGAASQAWVAAAPMGESVGSIRWEALVTCEALNIQLARFRPLVWDRYAGFYPEV